MDKQMIEEMANGYAVVNGKIIYFSNMLNKYRNEFKDLEEVVKEMNGLMKQNDSYMAQIEYWKHKAEEKIPEGAVVLTREEYGRLVTRPNLHVAIDVFTARKETAEKFAERLKDYYNWGFPFNLTISDKKKLFSYIDEICKEITEGKS